MFSCQRSANLSAGPVCKSTALRGPADTAMVRPAMVDASSTIGAFWQACRQRHPELAAVDHYDVWRFGDSDALCDELLALVLAGRKTATAGLLWDFESGTEPMPVLGGYSIVTDSTGAPACLLQTLEVTVRPYAEVPADFAFDEGEGDRTLESWRRGHWAYFSRRCLALGREAGPSMPVVCERFRLVAAVTAAAG